MNRAELQHERGVVCPLYGGLGWIVNATSSAVHAKGVTPGIPDLYVQAEPIGLSFWHETKVGKRRQTLEQARFMGSEKNLGRIVVLGPADAAIQFLAWLGVGARAGDTIRLAERRFFTHQIMLRHAVYLPEKAALLAERWYASSEHNQQLVRWGYAPPVPQARRHP